MLSEEQLMRPFVLDVMIRDLLNHMMEQGPNKSERNMLEYKMVDKLGRQSKLEVGLQELDGRCDV